MVLTVPNSKPIVITEETAKMILANTRKSPLTREEHAAIKARADRWRRKPGSVLNG